MYRYRAYGLQIFSDIALSELPLAKFESPDLRIQIYQSSDRYTVSPEPKSDYFRGSLEQVGQFTIVRGQKIRVESEADVDLGQLSTAILGPAMAIALRQRGLLVLHASCVNIGGRAVAFVGESGWGKSTFAGAFCQAGYAVLTDDVMAVETQEMPQVIPGYPQIKFWPSAVQAVGQGLGAIAPLHRGTDKVSCRLTQGFQTEPLPLSHIYVLGKGSHHAIEPLSAQAAFAALVTHTRGMKLLTTPGYLSAHMQQCGQMLKQVKFSTLVRKPGLEELPRLMEMVIADCRSEHQIAAALP